MRKLETLMMKAVHDAVNWKLSNTEVRRERSSYATHTVRNVVAVQVHAPARRLGRALVRRG